MNFFQRTYRQIENHILRRADDSRIRVEAAMRSNSRGSGSLSGMLERQAESVQAKAMKDYKAAVAAATDPENPDRSLLYQIYRNLLLDNHTASLIDSRILYTQRSPRKLVDASGNEDKEVIKLLERPWFLDCIYKVIFEQFQGTTLLETYDLTPEGELDIVTEIPQPHFNAKKGIVLKSPGDTNGWAYKDGIFADYYVQIGKDGDLGMLEQLAPIILAKKLAMGSNLDYIEKYGVPALFITTDREDDARLKELYEAAMNFKSNSFMVGRGEEKFEVGKDVGNGTAPFLELMNFCDEQIAKRILGGSGIADEKSFVGSAEIQFKLAKDRFENDKLFFSYVFNKLIKPRLVKLSPVYAPLENLTLEWDDTETMSKKELIDIVMKLGGQYELDPEQVEQITGIKILGLKSNPIADGPTDPKS